MLLLPPINLRAIINSPQTALLQEHPSEAAQGWEGQPNLPQSLHKHGPTTFEGAELAGFCT
jgi:hypothetical protein